MDRSPVEPGQVLMPLRMVWGAMIMGLLVACGVFVYLIQKPDGGEPLLEPSAAQLMRMLALGVTATMIPIGLFARTQIFKRHWKGPVITPVGYSAGQIVALACCEGPAMLGLVVAFLNRSLWPELIPPAVAMVTMLMLWPGGGAMFKPDEASAGS